MTAPRRTPLDRDLYDTVVEEAKHRFAVWPSAYASGWVVKTYKERGGKYAGQARGQDTGLTKWFGEEWVDLSRPTADGGYEPCGRKSSDDPADYPKCRPLAEALRMSPDEVADAVRRKRRAERQAEPVAGRSRAPVMVPTYQEDEDMRHRRNPAELLLLNPAATRTLTMGEVQHVMADLQVPKPWRTRFMQGLTVEWSEHGGGIDAHSVGSLVIDHLNEDEDYYRRSRRNPSSLPEGFTTRFGGGVSDDYVPPAVPETQRVLRGVRRGEVVTVGKTQWVIKRPVGDVQAYAYKHPSKRTKTYEILLAGTDDDEDEVVVFEVGGSGQQISEVLTTGPLRRTGETADLDVSRRNPATSSELRGADRLVYLDDVWSMYLKAYEKIGLIVTRPEDFLSEYDVWEVSVDDTGTPRAFCLYKSTAFGLKVGLSGSDGSPEGRALARESFSTKYLREGVYGEVSHRPAELARAAGVPVVCANVAANVLNKTLDVVDDVHYVRTLMNVGPVKKMLVGRPVGVPTTDIQQPSCPAVRTNPSPVTTTDDDADIDAHYACLIGL